MQRKNTFRAGYDKERELKKDALQRARPSSLQRKGMDKILEGTVPHRDGDSIIAANPDLHKKQKEETKTFDEKSDSLAETVVMSFKKAKLFEKERHAQIDMASVLLFDAINDLPTRHRIVGSWDRWLYICIHGSFFRNYICLPVALFNMSLIFYEEYNLDLVCQIFHLIHFTIRLYLRCYSDTDGRVKLKDLKKTVSKVLRHRSEQFEIIGFSLALAQLIAVTLHPETHELWVRAFRVYVGERAKRASCSNTRRANHTAYSNCTLMR